MVRVKENGEDVITSNFSHSILCHFTDLDGGRRERYQMKE